MGIFDRLKKKKELPKVERDLVNYVKKSLDGNTAVVVDGLTRSGKIEHNDGAEMDIILGQIAKIGDETFRREFADYIAFEIPIGQKITEDVLLAVIAQYEKERGNSEYNSEAFYIGRVQDGIVGNKSLTIEKSVKDRVNLIKQNRRIDSQIRYEKRKREEEIASEKARQEGEIRRSEYQTLEDRKFDERRQHPELKMGARYAIGEKIFIDYDGIDITDGKVLRIRQTDKVCKNYEGTTYLYSAYIDRVKYKYDVEFIGEDEPIGNFVCFTLPGRLEDIVTSGNQWQIQKVLELLSGERGEVGELTYIGGIDSRGQISRSAYPESQALAAKVTKMQENYLMRKLPNSQNRQANNYSDYDDRI